jgi:hypothetical protein
MLKSIYLTLIAVILACIFTSPIMASSETKQKKIEGFGCLDYPYEANDLFAVFVDMESCGGIGFGAKMKPGTVIYIDGKITDINGLTKISHQGINYTVFYTQGDRSSGEQIIADKIMISTLNELISLDQTGTE